MTCNDTNKLCSYYEQNRSKPWNEWLDVSEVFPRTGKQGTVGIMIAKTDPSIKYVFKLSQYINYLAEHEGTIMTSLQYCPGFCRVIGTITCNINPYNRKEGNPFKVEGRSIEKEVLLLEYLENSYKLCDYIMVPKIPEDILYTTIKHTLLSVCIAQRKENFSHYDLHSNNIMLTSCDRNMVCLYVLDDNNQFCIPTYGVYPTIIDFGFSYSKGLDGGYLWPSLNHTSVGFLSATYDPIADPKLFLITVSDEIHCERKTEKSKILRNITKNNYLSLPLDWGSGWDTNFNDKEITDKVLSKLESLKIKSNTLIEYEYQVIDIIQSLIILPLKEQKYDDELFCRACKAFFTEFEKIENQLNSLFYQIYILKGVVDAARVVKEDYEKKETRDQAVTYFNNIIKEKIDSIADYCILSDLQGEKMLCSLLYMTKGIESILFQELQKRMKIKKKLYNEIPLQSVEEIICNLEINLPTTYTFNNDTVINLLY